MKRLDFFDQINEDNFIHEFEHLSYKNEDEMYREFEYNLTVSSELQNNGTLYAHIIVYQEGYPYATDDPEYDYEAVLFDTHSLIKYKKIVKAKKRQNLLFESGENEQDKEEEEEKKENKEKKEKEEDQVSCDADVDADSDQSECKDNKGAVVGEKEDEDDDDESDDESIIGHFRPELTIRPLCDWTSFKAGQIPPQIKDFYKIDTINNNYFPVIYFDDFWLFQDRLIPLNKTVTKVPLKIMHRCVFYFVCIW